MIISEGRYDDINLSTSSYVVGLCVSLFSVSKIVDRPVYISIFVIPIINVVLAFAVNDVRRVILLNHIHAILFDRPVPVPDSSLPVPELLDTSVEKYVPGE